MEMVKHLNITANKDDYDADVKKILENIRPNWKQDNIDIKVCLSVYTVKFLYRKRIN